MPTHPRKRHPEPSPAPETGRRGEGIRDMLIVLVDDLRDFRDGRPAVVLRSSIEALDYLNTHPTGLVDELWLDHDLGPGDDIRPVVTVLERLAFQGTPFPVQRIYVHTANPPAAASMLAGLHRWSYNAIRTDTTALISAPAPDPHTTTQPTTAAGPAPAPGCTVSRPRSAE